MEERSCSRINSSISDEILCCVMPFIQDSNDRDALSKVCRSLYELDGLTRKHVTISLCYTTTPERLRRRFVNLESLKLKGQPRAAMFNLIPEDWGGFVTPWVREIADSLDGLRSLHFRRMIVVDSDLELLARARGGVLESLKLDQCSGFSTDGLLHIGRSCRNLKTLFLDDCSIVEKDGNWLHEVAVNNTVLETLNFYMSDLSQVRCKDLELIANNCPSLSSVKIGDSELMDLVGFFRAAGSLEEFCGGSFNDHQPESYITIALPKNLRSLGFTYMGGKEMPIVFPFANLLKKLDLVYALLRTENHCTLLQRCPNLEVLETRGVIGDRGLEVLARHCKKLMLLRIEQDANEHGLEDEEGLVTHRGLIALAQGCLELQYLAVYVSNITNSALECIGTYSKKLSDFRLVLLDREARIADFPLDNGVRTLLRGCSEKLRRFALYLRPGGLTDVGLGYIGRYSPKVKWMLLGCVGESDAGLLEFSRGCPSLQKLEMRGCCFSEQAMAASVMQLTSLKYFWVQGYRESSSGRDLMAMARPFWNIELIPSRQVIVDQDGEEGELIEQHPAQILAYYSLAGPRTDFPCTIVPLDFTA